MFGILWYPLVALNTEVSLINGVNDSLLLKKLEKNRRGWLNSFTNEK